ncbi:MAG: UbiX family flavin prenyltransferase [Acidobacteria bacterium]|nr:UbiX family flavin prenyltransferase [Acidobacteriota bacterium]
MEKEKPFLIGITGASGSIYAVRLISIFAQRGFNLDVVLTEHGEQVFSYELGFKFSLDNLIKYSEKKYKIIPDSSKIRVFDNRDLFAPPASGTANYQGMIIIPCSMGTLSAVASGRADTLINRSADVILKEEKKLVVVARETPLSAIHLENMLKLKNAGATILPAMPAFYNKPSSMEDLVDFIIAKILNILSIEHKLQPPWGDIR